MSRRQNRLHRPKTRRRHQSRLETTLPSVAQVETLEERLVLSPGILAVGADAGSTPRVAVYDGVTGTFGYEFNPYPDFPTFTGGVRTAVGYIPDGFGNANFPIIITAPGPGLDIANSVRVFSGFNGAFFAGYNPFPGFPGGIYVAAADFDRDGFSEVVTGAGAGGGPHVRILDLSNFNLVFDAFVYDLGFTGGVRVATGNVNAADEIPDIITAPGPGGGPHIKVFSGLDGVQFAGAAGSFFAYSPGFTGGVFVAAGDFNGNGRAEIVTGADAGGGPHVRIIDPFVTNPSDVQDDLNLNSTQFPFEPSFTGGVRVAAAYINNDSIADLIVTRGPGAAPDLRVFSGASFNVIYQGLAFVNPTFFGGSFPSSGKFIGEQLQLADADFTPDSSSLETVDDSELAIITAAAISRFENLGLPPELLETLQTVEFQVASLPDNLLGLARPGVILIDDDAAGAGWFFDATPLLDEEFQANGIATDEDAESGVDLLTVVLHELGHQLGLPDLDPAIYPQQLMTGTLPVGQRRLPDSRVIEFLFAGDDDLLDRLLAPGLF